MTYELYGKRITLGDKAQTIYREIFKCDPSLVSVEAHISSYEGPDLINNKPGTPLDKIIAKHTETELSEMLDQAIIDEAKEVYGLNV